MRSRSAAGLWLLGLMKAALFGMILAVSGNVVVSAALGLAVLALLVLVSNAKHAMLGEPLLFSDLALVVSIFRHPQFYLSAIKAWQRIVVGLAAVVLLMALAWLFVSDFRIHLAGIALAICSFAGLTFSLRSASVRGVAGGYGAGADQPDAYRDVGRHGLLPTVLLHWRRWKESRDPPPCADQARQPPAEYPPPPELLIVIQGESFADPAELFGDPGLALPGLSAARANAWQSGRLKVSGFGAYTMRTEYGVLFGRSEEELGFRRYDPFLTAMGEVSYALPARLKGAGWRSLFLHPHDMRFYGRDRIMPAGGFDELVGEDRFAAPRAGEGRYVTDAAMAERIAALAQEAVSPTLLYAVTIENHGPWAPDSSTGGDLLQSYLRLVRNSDRMLSTLADVLASQKRPALLVFFGDHRPSIPGVTDPGGDRDTPYVMLRVDGSGNIVRGENRQVDLTPAQLHHTILEIVLGQPIGSFLKQKLQ